MLIPPAAQPLSEDEFFSFDSPMKTAAREAVRAGFHIFPLQTKSKDPIRGSHGFKDAAPAVSPWDTMPDANIGIATGESDLCVLDFDQGLETIPAWVNDLRTFKVRTAKGLHVYLRGARATKKLFIGGKLIGDMKSIGGYVLAAGSVHPSGAIYTVVDPSPVAATPERVEELLKGAGNSNGPVDASVNGPKIPRGSHDNELHRIAGKLRHLGMEEEAIYNSLVEIVEKRCVDYGTDYLDMCRKHAHNITKHPVGVETTYIVGTKDGQHHPAPAQPAPPPDVLDRPRKKAVYPRFPTEVMFGTSIYDNFVKPIADENSRIPYFMWYPAMQIMMNYLGMRVHISGKKFKGGMYSVIIGRKGSIKSDSVNDAIEYFSAMGVADHAAEDTTAAQGRSLVWTAGSPEGLGADMAKTNCKNAILFYDELSMLTKKAGIDGSAMVSTLNQIYESGKFGNTTKDKKTNYSLAPGTYAASLIACTTDETFQSLWSTLAGGSTGLTDRTVFILQPEELPEMTPQVVINTNVNAYKTKTLMDKAIQQGMYKIYDQAPLNRVYKLGNRYGHRAEKYALYFAIDLGRDDIDEECIERACMLVDYEIAVKKFLQTYESVTREGQLQQQMFAELRNKGGQMRLRELERKMHVERMGTSLWEKTYTGARKAGWVYEFGTGVKSDPVFVTLVRDPEEEEDSE